LPERPGLRRLGPRGVLVAAIALLFLAVGVPGTAYAAPYPALPVEYGRDLLGNLSGPTLTPGASGTIAFSVEDPLPTPLSNVAVTFQVYAFNAFPGNATSILPVAGAPILSVAGASGESVNVTFASIPAGGVAIGSVEIATGTTTPQGTFAVRTAVGFVSNLTTYRLESRGWFTTSTWASATEEPNGSVTLNLSRLGVSGVTPETAVLVSSSAWPWVLGGLLAAAIVLTGVAAWVYFRRGPASSSGSR
jgi:hypothetical protein